MVWWSKSYNLTKNSSRWTCKTRGSSVLRTDSDSQLEGLLLDADAPISSQDSNVSLNSSWSSISSKSQDTPPVYFHSDDHRWASVICLLSSHDHTLVAAFRPCKHKSLLTPNYKNIMHKNRKIIWIFNLMFWNDPSLPLCQVFLLLLVR